MQTCMFNTGIFTFINKYGVYIQVLPVTYDQF